MKVKLGQVVVRWRIVVGDVGKWIDIYDRGYLHC